MEADLCWLSDEPLDLRRKYWLKHTTRQVAAQVTKLDSLLDINTQERRPAECLEPERHCARHAERAAAAGGRRV